ncbi:MAG: FAD-binding protein, partial [Chloroflexales bacterium]
GGLGVYLDFAESIKRLGKAKIAERYGNLFDMYAQITGENPYETPMRIYPAIHYTMGGLWVDYNLMSTIPGLFVAGEANFSDHGANRLGASALMQGLADGYCVLRYTVANYLAGVKAGGLDVDHAAFREAETEISVRVKRLLGVKGKRTVDSFHRELGKVLWDECGMGRNDAGLRRAIARIPALREEFWKNMRVPGEGGDFNQELEKAGRVADFLELGELLCRDALARTESCGGHFREESQTDDGEAKRDDENFSYAAAWQYSGDLAKPTLHKEALTFEYVKPSQRSYK